MKFEDIVLIQYELVHRIGSECGGCYMDIQNPSTGITVGNFCDYGGWEVKIDTPDKSCDFFPFTVDDVLDYQDTFCEYPDYDDTWEFVDVADIVDSMKFVPEWEPHLSEFNDYTTDGLAKFYNEVLADC